MANVFLNLPVPATVGPGASVNTAVLGADRTISLNGTGFTSIAIEVSQNNVDWTQLTTFNSVGGTETIRFASAWMRANVVRQLTPLELVVANCDVAADADGIGTVVVTLPVTAGAGTGAPVNISTLPIIKSAICLGTGVFGSFNGSVLIEASADATDWVSQWSFGAPGGLATRDFIAQFLRVRRVVGANPGTVTVQVGGAFPSGGGAGGGGFPPNPTIDEPEFTDGPTALATGPTIISGPQVPTSGPGVFAPTGTLYMNDDGRLFIKIGAEDTDWEELSWSEFFNVIDYGAIGIPLGGDPNDYLAINDSAALRDATEAAIAAGGGVVYFPGQRTYVMRDRPGIGASAALGAGSGTIGFGTINLSGADSQAGAQVDITFLGDANWGSKVLQTGNGGGDWYMWDLVRNYRYVRAVNLHLDGDERKGTWVFNGVDEHRDSWEVPPGDPATTTWVSTRKVIHSGVNGVLTTGTAFGASMLLTDATADNFRTADERRVIAITAGATLAANQSEFRVEQALISNQVELRNIAPRGTINITVLDLGGSAQITKGPGNPADDDDFDATMVARTMTFSSLNAANNGPFTVLSFINLNTITINNATAFNETQEGTWRIDNQEAGPLSWESRDLEQGYLTANETRVAAQAFPAGISRYQMKEFGPLQQVQRVRAGSDTILRLQLQSPLLPVDVNRGYVGIGAISEDETEWYALEYNATSFIFRGQDANGPLTLDGTVVPVAGVAHWFVRHNFGIINGAPLGGAGQGLTVTANTPAPGQATVTITGVTNTFPANPTAIGALLRISGGANAENVGAFPIVTVNSPTSIVIDHPLAVTQGGLFWWQIEGAIGTVEFARVSALNVTTIMGTEPNVNFTPGYVFKPLLYTRSISAIGGPDSCEIQRAEYVDGGVFDADEQTHTFNIRSETTNSAPYIAEFVGNRMIQTKGDALRLLGTSGQPQEQPLNAVSDLRVFDNVFIDNGRAAMSVQRNTTRVIFSRNYLSGGTDQLVDFEPTGDGPPSRFQITDNTFDNRRQAASAVGITLSGNGTIDPHEESIFSGNLVLYTSIVALNTGRLLIANNVITGPVSDFKNERVLTFDSGVDSLRFVNNIIRQVNTLPGVQCVRCSNRINAWPKRVAYSGNHIYGVSETTTVCIFTNAEQLAFNDNFIDYGGGSGTTAYMIEQLTTASAGPDYDIGRTRITSNTVRALKGCVSLWRGATVGATPNRGNGIVIADNVGGVLQYLVRFADVNWDPRFTPMVHGNAIETSIGFALGTSSIGNRLAIAGNFATTGSDAARVWQGSVDPEAAVVGSPGDLYLRTGTGESYWKATGVDTNTGWRQIATVDAAQTFVGQQRSSVVALVDGANVAINAAASNVFQLTATALASRQLDNPSPAPVAGQTWQVWFQQDAVGGRQLTFGTFYNFGDEGNPTFAGQAANIRNVITCVAVSATRIVTTTLAGYTA